MRASKERAIAHAALLAYRRAPKRTRNAAEEQAKQDLFRTAVAFTAPRSRRRWWWFR